MHAEDVHEPEMTSVVEQQHQHQSQQYVGGAAGAGGGSASEKLCCKDCGMNFDSRGSLDTHLHYHQENLMNQWVNSSSQTEESNNNNSKAGNHNSGGVQPGHVSAGPPKRDSITAPADSSETSSAVSEGPNAARMQQQHHHQEQQQQQQQQQQSQQQHHQQSFNHFSAPMFNEPQFFMQNEASAYMMQQQQQQQHHYSPDRSEESAGGPSPRNQVSGYGRYHPYQQHQQPQHYAAERANSVSSSSPRSTVQCEQCGAVCEDAAQLAEHTRTSHHAGSPGAGGAYPAPQPPQAQAQPPAQPPPQYQQLAGSPQQQSQQVTQSQQNQAQTQQQQMLASPPQPGQHQQQMLASPPQPGQHQQQMLASPPQPGQHQQHQQQQQQQQPTFEFVSVGAVKAEKQEPEEQSEILDLDSLKVQTHRFEEENFMRMQQHQQEIHMMQQQVMQQHQARGGTHSVSALLWPPAASQAHEYHPGLSPMGPMDSVSPIQEQQNQFMRGQQHMSQVEPPRHPGSPIITSTQPMPGHPMSAGLLQQNPKPPPLSGSQPWKSNEARRPKTYNCTACNKWFTSSGHLKRHYNTTLHKNAVKQSNQPDPANLPISAHHHPGRDANPARGAASRNSPELSSSSSPPNLMAGPSGEATRGLLHTPTTTTALFSSNNSNSSSNSSEATPAQPFHAQQLPPQHQQQVGQPGLGQCLPQGQAPGQSPGHQPASAIMASSLMYLGSPVSSPMGQQHPQHLQPMNSPSPQQAQAAHHLPMGSPSQLGASGHHPMNSPISPMQQHPVSMNSPSSMGSGQPGQHHHMHSPTGIMGGSLPAMASPQGSMMGGTSMPQQPYPNALPPHVTTITSIPALLESITTQLTTTGDQELSASQSQEMLPGFGTFSSHSGHSQPTKILPNYTQFGTLVGGGYMLEHSPQAVNVGGLNSEHEGMAHQERVYEASGSSYEMYQGESSHGGASTHYEYEMMQSAEIGSYPQPQQQPSSSQQAQYEANNNLPVFASAIKEEIDPNINSKKKGRAPKRRAARDEKDSQVSSSSKAGSHYISANGVHKCIECDKVFNKACYLTQHNKSFHSGDKPFKCNQCGKRFPHEYLHAEHLQKHAGDKPYKCEICPKQFNHKTDLRRHLCLHTGEKPYACETCSKGFIRKDHMMKHLETHRKKANQHKVHLRA